MTAPSGSLRKPPCPASGGGAAARHGGASGVPQIAWAERRADPAGAPQMALRTEPFPEKPCRGRRQADGLCRARRGGARVSLSARQPDLVVSVAQRDAGIGRARPLYRARPDRHGRFRQTRRSRPRDLPLRDASRLPRRVYRWRDRAATGRWCSSDTIGARRWLSTGPTATASGSPASPTWRRSCGRSPGTNGRRARAACFRGSARRPARR